MSRDIFIRGMVATAFLVAQAAYAQTTNTAPAPPDPAALVASLQKDVEALRGLTFKHPVPVAPQTPAELGRHMDKEMADAVPEAMAAHFNQIVKRLGLYRGPDLGNLRDVMRQVMTSQAAAYYDPDSKRIFVLAQGGNELEQGLIYAHELYHALQDQYFDLKAYVPDGHVLNGDQELARTAVVEGEATYIHTMWVVRHMTNINPPRALVGPAIQMQANLSIEQLRAMAGDSSPEAKAETDKVPPFILETLLGNYMKGAAFVFAVQEKGWSEVEKLYREYPPQSSEQILYPEKWFAREGVSSITWPDFSKEKVLRDWELLDSDVLGEIQWRIIFKVQEQADGDAAAAGWDGDRYAVFKRKGSDDTLLLLRTAWDSEAEATEFTAAYRRLLAVKYAGASEQVSVEQQGADVFIVEGGGKADLDALKKLVRQSKKQRG